MAQFDMGVFGKNTEAIAEGQVGKIYLLELTDVFENDENPFECSNIDELADLIETVGLISCCNGYKQGSGSEVVLTDGHRRFLAMKKLADEGRKYSFHGKEITGKIPVALMKQTPDPHKTALTMIAANAKRDMGPDEKNRIIDETKRHLDGLEKYGEWKWPAGKKAHWLAVYTGIKEHYIKDYLAGVNKAAVVEQDEGTAGEEKKQKEKASKEISEEEKLYKKSIKQLKKTTQIVKEMQAAAATLRGTLENTQNDDLTELVINLIKELQIYNQLK